MSTSAILRLIRLDKPVGVLLLLWPTWWALWLASAGQPSFKLVFIFTAGVFLMRSAGCAMNDIADRHFDAHVTRTKHRPLAMGELSLKTAVLIAALLTAVAFILVLFTNPFTIILSFVGAALAVIYPLLKRITHWPQLGLGLAFGWGVPMAFAAATNTIPLIVWVLFAAAIVWPLMYDTLYAMVDRADDIHIGVKSTAILFGRHDRLMIAMLQCCFIVLMMLVGVLANLSVAYYAGLIVASGLFVYQQYLVRLRHPAACFKAFLNNQWVGLVIFIGIVL